jgi:hypothetical protein
MKPFPLRVNTFAAWPGTYRQRKMNRPDCMDKGLSAAAAGLPMGIGAVPGRQHREEDDTARKRFRLEPVSCGLAFWGIQPAITPGIDDNHNVAIAP